ncbi:MAG: phosphate ABC transporter permease subunit PstC [Alphaproteobacteria bacterium]|nr:phosphate ABC transporter permease subunit PstC [Alphaproteobacteria bacterium]
MCQCRRTPWRFSRPAGSRLSDPTASLYGAGIRPDRVGGWGRLRETTAPKPVHLTRATRRRRIVTAETVRVTRVSAERGRAGAIGDSVFRALTFLFALLVLLILGGVIVSLIAGAWPALRTFGFFRFVASEVWNPVTQQFGALAAIYGTLVTSAIAMLIGIPVAFGVAVFITEISPIWLKRPLATMIELLAAIPSIIYGIWGLFVFAPFIQQYVQPAIIDSLGNIPGVGALFAGPPLGIGILTAGFILAIMVLPFISAIMRDVFETVPPMLKESAYGLGATRTEVVWQVVLPFTRIGVVGGIMLGLGRALGETMAVTFVIGNAHRISASILQPGTTISASLANEFTEAFGDLYRSSLIALGLILFIITFIVLAIAKMMLLRLQKQAGG